jgi:hypothetical protein
VSSCCFAPDFGRRRHLSWVARWAETWPLGHEAGWRNEKNGEERAARKEKKTGQTNGPREGERWASTKLTKE